MCVRAAMYQNDKWCHYSYSNIRRTCPDLSWWRRGTTRPNGQFEVYLRTVSHRNGIGVSRVSRWWWENSSGVGASAGGEKMTIYATEGHSEVWGVRSTVYNRWFIRVANASGQKQKNRSIVVTQRIFPSRSSCVLSQKSSAKREFILGKTIMVHWLSEGGFGVTVILTSCQTAVCLFDVVFRR